MNPSRNSHRSRRRSGTHTAARGIAGVCAGALLLTLLILLTVRLSGGSGVPYGSGEPDETLFVSRLPANPFGPEDFGYENGYLTCLSAPSRLGVDVSAHQQDIDWPLVAGSGVEFAMIRLGYRGTTSGGLYPDDFAQQNLRSASDAGLQVGAYFFSQALTPEEAAEEAAFCISMLESHALQLPLVFDWEYTGADTRTAEMTPEALLACAEAFCRAVEEAGYQPMIYFNSHLADTLLDLEALADYPFWLALYSDAMTYPHSVQMWQYTEQGSVPGIAGNADLNLWLGD